jgi:GDP-L-fucose synthase
MRFGPPSGSGWPGNNPPNFDPLISHALPALIRKFHDAKAAELGEVAAWGTGKPLREFLHVDDLATGAAFCLDRYDGYDHINCGMGSYISIADLAGLIARIVGYRGKIVFDTTKPDCTPQKLLDSSRLAALGWRSEISLEDGIASTYHWYLKNRSGATSVV